MSEHTPGAEQLRVTFERLGRSKARHKAVFALPTDDDNQRAILEHAWNTGSRILQTEPKQQARTAIAKAKGHTEPSR